MLVFIFYCSMHFARSTLMQVVGNSPFPTLSSGGAPTNIHYLSMGWCKQQVLKLHTISNFPGFLPFDFGQIDDDESLECTERIMMNLTLRVAVTITTMESQFKAQMSNGSAVNVYGSANIAYAFLLDLQDIFNFGITFVPSMGFITEGLNGTLNGAGAQITSGQVDICLDISKPVIYRAKYLTFLHAIKQDRVAIMFRQPKIQQYQNTLLGPFKYGSWKCVSQVILVIFLSTAVIYRRRDIHLIILPVTGAILARYVSWTTILHRSSKSLHVVLVVSSLFGLTMYSIYSAFIVSSLRKQVTPVRRFQDLIDFEYELQAQGSLPDFTNVYVNDAKVGRRYAAIARKNFINEKSSLRRLFTSDDDEDFQKSSEGGDVQETSGGGVAWFVLKSDFYYLALQNNYTTREICSISKLEPVSRPEHPRLLSMFIPKGERNLTNIPIRGRNGIKEQFNRKILVIFERGLGQRHVLNYESEFQPKCEFSTQRVQVQQIRFRDVNVAYRILGCGALVAFGVLILGEVVLPYFWITTKRNVIMRRNKNQVFEGKVVFIKNAFQPGNETRRVGLQYLW